MSWGKGPNYSQKNAAVGFGDLFEGEEQSGLEFASAGHELAKACTVFHGFWKHWLQFSIIMQQEKTTDCVIYEMLLLDISFCDLKLSSNVETPNCCSNYSHRVCFCHDFSCKSSFSSPVPSSLQRWTQPRLPPAVPPAPQQVGFVAHDGQCILVT